MLSYGFLSFSIADKTVFSIEPSPLNVLTSVMSSDHTIYAVTINKLRTKSGVVPIRNPDRASEISHIISLPLHVVLASTPSVLRGSDLIFPYLSEQPNITVVFMSVNVKSGHLSTV